MKVIGTAGHIDHGKSSLVLALTGIDPDRLQEERRRGMTIDLGFAWLTLPSGQEVSLVDVPGHERFVKNMLAGVGGIDVALVVVAADELVMPQTREHVDILDLLGVRHGVVALTKTDLVDSEWRDLAVEEVRDYLTETSLAEAPIIPISVRTGEGLPRLVQALEEVTSTSPERADREFPYLPVDRVFTVAGFGTVVTGTLHDGSLAVGQEIEIMPAGRKARIRSMQTHRRQVDHAGPGARLAVNLAGIEREDVVRGDMVALPGTLTVLRRFDARVSVLASAPFGLRHGAEVTVHLGAAERAATISLPGGASLEPGESGWARVRLATPVSGVRCQRFILRQPAPARTLAGGQIADIRPRGRMSEPERAVRLTQLLSSNLEEAVLAVLRSDRPRTDASIAQALTAPLPEVRSILEQSVKQGRVRKFGPGFISVEGWQAVAGRVMDMLRTYHLQEPMRAGMSREEVRRRLRWEQDAWSAAVQALVDAGAVRESGPHLAESGHVGGVSSRRDEVDRVMQVLAADPYSPPSGSALLDAANVDHAFLMTMATEGLITHVSGSLFFDNAAYEEMLTWVVAFIRQERELTVTAFRDHFQTSRKYALAFLEHLDGRRITQRRGDIRILGPRAPACA